MSERWGRAMGRRQTGSAGNCRRRPSASRTRSTRELRPPAPRRSGRIPTARRRRRDPLPTGSPADASGRSPPSPRGPAGSGRPSEQTASPPAAGLHSVRPSTDLQRGPSTPDLLGNPHPEQQLRAKGAPGTRKAAVAAGPPGRHPAAWGPDRELLVRRDIEHLFGVGRARAAQSDAPVRGRSDRVCADAPAHQAAAADCGRTGRARSFAWSRSGARI